jgi:hypothetical protein
LIVAARDILDGMPMTLDELFQNGAAYLVYKGPTQKQIAPQGTVFFVGYHHAAGEFVYAVTAAHCIDGAPNEIKIWYRDDDGRKRAAQANRSEWVLHPDTDVAVALVDPNLPVTQFPIFMIDPEINRGIFGGMPIVTVGLFVGAANFKSVEPIARFGHIARADVTAEIRLRGRMRSCHTHIIESMSWGGQSGSPVFCFDDRFEQAPDFPHIPEFSRSVTDSAMRLNPRLVGLLHGHFSAQFEIEKGVDAQLNAGLSVVIPAQYIMETLRLPEVEKERNKNIQGPRPLH